ncbi:MAG: N-acetylmuramoyl-L-alanine amidase [Lachnospiraceae bacterium]|nr:N-acetylmuramoyl-L-alanine amidase [Lachnospiraceae bacterium]
MNKKENYFLRLLMIESVVFLIFACTGIYFMPFLEAKERQEEWQKDKNLIWKDYFTAMVDLENIIEKHTEENKNTKKNFLDRYEQTIESGKVYIEEVKLEKQNNKDEEIQEQRLGNSYIKIKKTGIKEIWGKLEHNYMNKKVSVVIYGEDWEKLEKSDMTVVWKGHSYVVDAKKIPVSLKVCQYQQNEEGIKDAILLEFDADKIYSYQLCQDGEYVYITFCPPKEVYDKIVVVDAGHGGTDTGTYAKSGDWDEKDFNLDFARKVEEYWDHDNIKLYFSRLEDTKVTLVDRVNFANDLQADLFVSLHCNSSDENSGSGLEALYKSNGYTADSKAFAKKCLEALEKSTGFTNRGLLKGKRIYIIRNANMPTVLLELGFLTDAGDLSYISKEENRKNIAQTICQVIWDEFVHNR